MKVLLVSPNIESLPDPVFPLGLAYICAALKKNRIQYQVLDLCFVQDYETAIASAVSSFHPDLIGLSLRNLDNVSYPNYISYLSFYRQVVKIIRNYSDGIIVIGGSGFTLMPETLLDYLGADWGIVGEGEHSLVKLINDLEAKKNLYRVQASEVIENLDTIPMPDRSGFDNKAYLSFGGMGNLQTKRGCPFKCIYCTYPIIEGNKVRLRSPRLICDEIENMLESGMENIFFVDNKFNFPVEHAQSICREIITRKLPIKWSCYATPEFITPALIELMLAAGCTGLEFGSDAANDTMLVSLGKSFTLKDIRNASTICKSLGMPYCHSLLLGGPGETMETIQQTCDAIVDISPTAVICMLGIRIFPKTRLSSIAMEEGIIGSDSNFLSPIFYLSPLIKNEILLFIEEFSKKNSTWIFPGLNININVELQKKMRRIGIKGPLWEHMGQKRLNFSQVHL